MQNQVTFKLNQTTKYDTIGEVSTAIVLIWYRHFQRYDGLDLGFTERQIPSLSLWCEYTGSDEIVFACWCVSELVNYSGHISTRIIYTKQSLLIFLKEIVFFFQPRTDTSIENQIKFTGNCIIPFHLHSI